MRKVNMLGKINCVLLGCQRAAATVLMVVIVVRLLT